jgi:Ca2+-binding RTX toxin-like protein
MFGYSGADTMLGGAGADELIGGGGADTLTGGGGSDRFVYWNAADSGASAGSRDLITDFTQGQDLLDLAIVDGNTTTGADDPFRFLGTGAFDGQPGALRYGYDSGSGVTVLEADTNGDGTADFAIGLTGNLALAMSDFAPGSAVSGIAQPLTLTGTGGNDVLDGGTLNDTLIGLAGNDTLNGAGGDDTLNGGDGADRLDGGSGSDTVTYADWGMGRVAVNLNDGVADLANSPLDTLISIENAVGTAFGDVFVGSAGANRLDGGAGADWLFGYLGVDTLTGGSGADLFYFGTGDSSPSAGSRDRITDFTPGEDLLDLTGMDAIPGTAGRDGFTWVGTTAFAGQAGELRYAYDSVNGVTTVQGDTDGDGSANFAIDLAGNLALNSGNFTAGSIAAVAGGPMTLIGTNGADVLNGGTADDTLIGLGGDDSLNGGGGNDLLNGGDGADRLDGGAGTDTVTYADWGMGRVSVNLNDGVADVAGSPLDTLISIENAIGTNFNDMMIGSTGANRLEGGNGDDWLFGYDGNDTIVGGAGTDTLIGGNGSDRFEVNSLSATDIIADFTPGDSSGDTVALIGLGVSSFAQVQAMMQQTGADVHIHFGSGSDPVLVLSNTTVAAFNQNDFVYS